MKLTTLPPELARRIEPVLQVLRKTSQFKILATTALVAVGLRGGLSWAERISGVAPEKAGTIGLVLWLALLLGLALVWWRRGSRQIAPLEIARKIESEHPDLQAALLTALEPAGSGRLQNMLHGHVVADAVRHGLSHDWVGERARRKLAWWRTAAVFGCFALLLQQGYLSLGWSTPEAMMSPVAEAEEKPPAAAISVEVRPGDAAVERGGRLVIEARFHGGIPEKVEVVQTVNGEEGKEVEFRRITLQTTVESGTFGGVLTGIEQDGHYRVVYGSSASAKYSITTYVHPALVQADAVITPPAYSGQPAREVKNTQSITVLEGSGVRFFIKVNKPVAQAELFGEDKISISLVATEQDPLLLVGGMMPAQSQKYRLHLVDAQDRSNKQPPWFKVNVTGDQPPKVEIVFPKRDLTVSPLQEMPLETKVWDDIGVHRAGAVFMLGDETREVLLSGEKLEGGRQHELKTLMEMEKLKASPRQLMSYYVWAEDSSPSGSQRRVQSDMFFAEVRHFEDVFREGDSPSGEGEQQQGAAAKLAQLQKQIVNATWKLVRETGMGKKFEALGADMGVVKESQDLALAQAATAMQEAEDAETKAALGDALSYMKAAAQALKDGVESKSMVATTDALVPEKQALEALYRAQSREHRVMRSQSSKSSGASQPQERQLMQLELKQQEKRYEEEKAAGEEKSAEQVENLQVLNRLKELARRQEALAEKIKELETKLQQAATEDEKQELNQQLKRLQEEQQELLRDLDDLKQRMEQPDNQSSMAQEREKLDAAREQVRQAAEELAKEKPGSAASAATKATSSLEEIRDEFRERTSKQFAEEMRQLKEEADGLAGRQELLAEAMSQAAAGKKPADPAAELERHLEGGRLAREVETQREALQKLMEQMRKTVEQSEQSEPLLSNALHDAMRRAHAAGIDDALADARDHSQFGAATEAQERERKAASGIEELKQNVEKAAESVLGSETEALRMARNELDRLLEEASKDLAEPGKGTPGASPEGRPSAAEVAKGDAAGAEMEPAGEGGTSASTPPRKEKQLSEGKDPAQGKAGQTPEPGEGQGMNPGEAGKEGQSQRQAGGPAPGDGALAGGQSPSAPGSSPQGLGGGRPGVSPPQGQGSSGVRSESSAPASESAGSSAGGGVNQEGGWFFDQPGEAANDSAITGAGFEQWADRLRRVEEALSAPDLRQQAARVLDEARDLRGEARRNNLPPQSAAVQMRIVQPLAELKDRVLEELARREKGNELAPLDRDPVPHRYREMVRRYYTELGAGN